MNKATLLQALSKQAVELDAVAPSEAKFESWIQKGLVPKAEAIGKCRGQNPDWIYPPEALLTAHEVLRLEADGAQRVRQKRIGLALAGFDYDSILLREDIAAEFDRWVKRERRQKGRNFGNIRRVTDAHEISDREKVRLSELDPELETADLSLKPGALLRGLFLAFFGTSDTNVSLGKKGQSSFKNIDGLRQHIAGPTFSMLTKAIVDVTPLLWGLLGSADETDLAAKERILKASNQQVVAAVSWYRDLLNWLEHPDPLTKADFARLFGISPERMAKTLAHFSWQPQMLGFILVADIAKLFPSSNRAENGAHHGSQN